MKSVLISIQPQWCELIAAGKKILEIRKTKNSRICHWVTFRSIARRCSDDALNPDTYRGCRSGGAWEVE